MIIAWSIAGKNDESIHPIIIILYSCNNRRCVQNHAHLVAIQRIASNFSCSISFTKSHNAVGNLKSGDASFALIAAAIWTALIQFGMIIVGTFIIKRFSTSFSIGFLLGLVVIVAQQYLLLSVTFWKNQYGSSAKNLAFANLAFTLFVLYAVFAATLMHFKESVMVAAVDAKGWRRSQQITEEDI